MKKFICVILAFALFVTPLVSFGATSNDDSMNKALSKVLERITIPEYCTNFNSEVYDYDGDIEYSFYWDTLYDVNNYVNVSVTCDSEGRIKSYYLDKDNDTQLYDIKKQDVIDLAVATAKTMFPEAFANENDKLVVDESSYYASYYGSFNYSVTFNRIRNSVPVEYNDLSMSFAVCNGNLELSNAFMSYDYDYDFIEADADIEKIKSDYFKEIPLDITYILNYDEEKNSFVPSYAYYLNDNTSHYLNLSTGKAIPNEYDNHDQYYRFNYRFDDMYPEPEYIEEPVSGLISAEEIEKKIKSIPELKYLEKVDFMELSLVKEWNNEYHYVFATYDEYNDGFNCIVTADATTGKIISANNMDYDDQDWEVQLDSKTLASADKKIDAFLNSICKEEYAQTVPAGSSVSGYIVSKFYTRVINGVEFKADRIFVEYNTKTNTVQYFDVQFTDVDFSQIEPKVSNEQAEQLVIDNVDFEVLYTCYDNKYIKAAIPGDFNYIDGLSGELYTYDYSYDSENIYYGDISGHWVDEIALKLAEAGIGFYDGMLEPEKDITLKDFADFMFVDGVIRCDDIYADYYDTEEFISKLKNNGIVLANTDVNSPITREDAFKLMVTCMGYGDVAELDIYKVDYADSYLLTDGKVGYAAILSGMGIISGDGSYLYPNKNLTRSETLAMAYKYLTNN